MATIFNNVDCNLTSDALYRSTFQTFSANLSTLGLVKTADAGQINFATATKPTTPNFAMGGYEVFRFDDALQATAPVYLKFEYGISDSATGPGMYVTAGQGTDGAGALVGTQVGARAFSGSAATVTTPLRCYMSGAPNRIQWAWWSDNSTASSTTGMMWGSVERTKDVNGNDTGEGLLCAWGRGFQESTQQYIPFNDYGVPLASTELMALQSVSQAGSSVDGNVFACPIFHSGLGSLVHPGLGLLVVRYTDFAQHTTYPISMYGTERTYLCAGPNDHASQSVLANPAGCRFLMLWE